MFRQCLDDEMRVTSQRLVVEPAPMQGREANLEIQWKSAGEGFHKDSPHASSMLLAAQMKDCKARRSSAQVARVTVFMTD